MGFLGLFGNSTPQQQPLDRRAALAGIPALTPGVTFKDDKDGHIIAVVPVKKRTGFFSRFQTMADTHKVRLDEIGAFVIHNINGERTVQEIVDAFAAKYRVNKREAELSMADFLKSLAQRNIIAIGIR